ncbi:YbaB/EbfC family nucleoid-associated protein [Nocardia sp. NPDC050406]|uniref:YbaB/EbfC family nucleoid-associated protein n=1 Tax=Nocardia sp. NPDC050406 TaxID=3364318 RepID=UPI0037ADD1B0
MSGEMDGLVRGVTDQLEALEAALYELKRIRGRFRSEDGSVTAEVDGEGALTGLWLAESVTARQPAEVSQLILWACARAAEEAGSQRSRIVARLNESFAPGNVAGNPDSA